MSSPLASARAARCETRLTLRAVALKTYRTSGDNERRRASAMPASRRLAVAAAARTRAHARGAARVALRSAVTSIFGAALIFLFVRRLAAAVGCIFESECCRWANFWLTRENRRRHSKRLQFAYFVSKKYFLAFESSLFSICFFERTIFAHFHNFQNTNTSVVSADFACAAVCMPIDLDFVLAQLRRQRRRRTAQRSSPAFARWLTGNWLHGA